MIIREQTTISAETKRIVRIVYSTMLITLIALTAVTVFIIETKEFAFENFINADADEIAAGDAPSPFPVGVDPRRKIITEHPGVNAYFETHVLAKSNRPTKTSWFHRLSSKLAHYGWYQNLASPVSRVLVVLPGERKEQVVDNFGDILGWDEDERERFPVLVARAVPALSDGKYFPGSYVVSLDATPEDVAAMVIKRFNAEVVSRYTDDIEAFVRLEDTLTLASLLEREAYEFEDMRHIAGIIWNRLFIDMNLQIDATLQYAKGSRPSTPVWWPVPKPADKYIDSPYNTYKNSGLPPSPISTPSLDAILAALNPKSTECLFYFHDANSDFHCTPTYEEHVALLKKYYGRGK